MIDVFFFLDECDEVHDFERPQHVKKMNSEAH